MAVNQLINVAVAEKVSALRTEEYFAERALRGGLKKALQVNLLTDAKRRRFDEVVCWRSIGSGAI